MDLTILQAVYNHSIRFTSPDHAASSNLLALGAAMLGAFQHYGVTPEDIQFESGHKLSDYQVTCSLRHLGGVVKYKLSGVDAFFVLSDGPSSAVFDPAGIAEAVYAIGRGNGTSARDQTVSIAAHVRIEGGELAGLLARYVATPLAGLSGFYPSAVSFVADLAEDLRTTVELQPSLTFRGTDAAFLRAACELRGSIVPAEAIARVQQVIQTLLREMELVARWPSS